MNPNTSATFKREPWNKGKLVGQKAPLKLKDIWAIRVRLQLSKDIRNLALFNLAIDSKFRACDLVKLKVRDIAQASLHDRLIIIDGSEAWSAHQSFNGMAQSSHTSIERSDPEMAAMKIQAYKAIWGDAQEL
jgi:hypothetical protein